MEKGKQKKKKVGEEKEGIREEKMKRLEWEIERKEREEKRSNIVVRGVFGNGRGQWGEALGKLEKLLEDIGVVVKVGRGQGLLKEKIRKGDQ